jgi:signal transduction histidine kinase
MSTTQERLRILLPVAAVLLLLVLLTLLLVGSRSTELELLDRMQASLQSYELRDTELTRDALLARAGLLANYDPLAADRRAMREAIGQLQEVVGEASPATQRALQPSLDALAADHQAKLTAVEHFKSNNALLRNSLLYFAYVGPALRLPLQQQALAARLGRLSYAVLSFLQSPTPEVEQEILSLLAAMEHAPGGGPDLDSLVAHGRLLVQVLPRVDLQLQVIHATPIGAHVQLLRKAAMARGAEQERLAQHYRQGMYAASLCLLASIAWLLARLRSRALALRSAEDRLRQQRLQLLESNKLATLGMHLEGVAHDLRSPLQAVQSSASQVARFWPELQSAMDRMAASDPTLQLDDIPWHSLRPQLKTLPGDLQQQSAALSNLAQYLLDFGRPRAAGQHAAFDLNTSIEQALRLVRHSIRRRTDRFELQLAQGLPAAHGDPFALGQVLVNLLENALDALPGRQQAVRIRTLLSANGGLSVEVEDEGHGIAPEHMARLFEPFFTTKQGRGGTGLGLGLSRAMLESMGATLQVASTPGVGTRATIIMPAAAPAAGGSDGQR